MAVEIKAIPVLRDKAAERLVRIAEENLRNRETIDFRKEAANSNAILKKSVRKD